MKRKLQSIAHMPASLMKALCMLTLLLSTIVANAFEFAGCQYTPSGSTCTLTSGTAVKPGLVIVPDYAYDENGRAYAVTKVAANAFQSVTGIRKIVVGDNVEFIGNKAFEHFGDTPGDCVLILGKGMEKFGNKAFENLGKYGGNHTVLIRGAEPPKVNTSGWAFASVTNTKFYVQDKETYDKFRTTGQWAEYDKANNSKGNEYRYPFPVHHKLKPGKWITVMFSEALNSREVESYFGKGTKVSILTAVTHAHKPKRVFNFAFDLVNNIEANTPYLIKVTNKENEYISEIHYQVVAQNTRSFAAIEETDRTVKGYMTGVTDNYELKAKEVYLRSNDDGTMYFYAAESDGVCAIAKGKCYFYVKDEQTGEIVEAKMGVLVDNEATGISDLRVEEQPADNRIYNINGQYEGTDPMQLPKGIHIVNGRKFVVR